MRCRALLLLLMVASGSAIAETNGLDGGTAFIACQGCHSLAAGEPHGVGPNLAGLAGRAAGVAEGFAYSPALKDSGISWDAASLKAWILAAEGMVPGTWMLYRNHLQASEVDRLVDYILQPE